MVKVKTKILDDIQQNDKHTARDGSTTETRDKSFKGRLKRSTFMITINTNRKRFNSEFEAKFKKFGQFIFGGKRLVKYFVCKHCEAGNCKPKNDAAGPNCLESINTVVSYELAPISAGKSSGKLHLHAAVSAVHSGSCQIDISKIKQLAYQYFGYRLYVSIRGAGDPVFGRRMYLERTGRTEEAEALETLED